MNLIQKEPRIFISYSWKNADAGDKIDGYFKSIGITMERDVRDNPYKGKITKYMEKINECDFVLMIISKDFLQSRNCMKEAFELYNDDRFEERFLPIFLKDAKFFDPIDRAEYTIYWENKYNELNNKYKEIKNIKNISAIDSKNLILYADYSQKISEFLGKIADLNAKTFEYHLENKFKDIIEAIGFDDEELFNEIMEIQFLSDKEEQLARIEEFLFKYHDYRYGLYLKAVLYHESKNYKAALINWTNYLKYFPDDNNAWNNIGNALSALGENEEAIKCHDEAIKLKPDYYEAWNNKGNALSALGKKEEAIKSYDEAIKIKPNFYEAWNNKGLPLFNLGKNEEAIKCYEEAIKCYEEAIKIKSDYYEAWNNKGTVLYSLGKKDEAIKCYDKAIEIKSDSYVAWYCKGWILGKLGKHKEAIKCFNEAIKIKHDDPSVWQNKALALSALGKKEEAIKSYDEAIKIKPDYHEAWYDKGLALEGLGRKEEAEECFKKHDELKNKMKNEQK